MSYFYKRNRRTKKQWCTYEGIKEHKQLKFIKNQLINKNGNICAICGKPIKNMKDCTIDHIIPKSKGGLTTIENCQLAHFKCNQDKDNEIMY